MLANTVTDSRLLLTFVVITLFGKKLHIDFVAITTIPFIFILDAVDGYIAHKYKQTNEVGAVLDIALDRIIENICYIYFATPQIIHVWIPSAIFTRGIITDTIRSFTLIQAITSFEMIKNKWTHAATSSRISRFFSGTSKIVCFLHNGTLTHYQNASDTHNISKYFKQ